MKRLLSLALVTSLAGCSLPAQVPVYAPAAPSYTVPAESLPPRVAFTPDQLDALLGPIALYPDALIALILPASTDPSDIVLAARYLQAGGDPAQIDVQPWEDSVRSLAHYSQVIRWMDENLAWTKQLGDAFETQPADVMNAIQRLRARARAAGTLITTPQQQVVYQDNVIEIVPTQPDVIYVPYYDPGIVYVAPPRTVYTSPGAFFGFSSGFATGWWLSYGLDWGSHRVWAVNHTERERLWREHRGEWNRFPTRVEPDHRPDVHVWHPVPGGRPREHVAPSRPTQVVQPGPHAPGHDPREGDPRRNDPRRNDGYRDAGNRGIGSTPPTPSPVRTPAFVGPTSPNTLRPPLPQPLSTPPTVTPLPQVTTPNPVPPSTRDGRRYERRSDATNYGGRSAPVVGPVAAPAPSQRTYTPPPQASGGAPAVAAPPPRPAPPLHHYTPAPAAAQAAPPPPPQAAPPPQQQQQQQQQQQSSNSSNDDDKRRPPFIRPR